MLKMVFALSRIGFLVLVVGIVAWGAWYFIRRRIYGDRAGEIECRERALRGRERAAELEQREVELHAREAALERARSALSELHQQLEAAEFEKLMRLLDRAHPGIRAEAAKTRSERVRERLRRRAQGTEESPVPESAPLEVRQAERQGS